MVVLLFITGSNTLKEQYESVNFTTMSGICSNWDTAESSDCLIFICFPAIHPLVKSIFEFFFKLAEPERNDIFRDIWKENLSDAYQTHSCLTQQDIIVHLYGHLLLNHVAASYIS